MNKYEIMFIVRPDMPETEIATVAKEITKVLTDKNATIIEEKAMGQRELAYEINKFKVGYYFLLTIESNNEAISEFERLSRINENLIRHLITKVESK